jgi:hypothetical protein
MAKVNQIGKASDLGKRVRDNIGEFGNKTGSSRSNSISSVGNFNPSRSTLLGNAGSFGNVGSGGSGGFDLQVPTVDPSGKGGVSFMNSVKNDNEKRNTIYGGSGVSLSSNPVGNIARTGGTSTTSTVAPSITIDNTPKTPSMFTTTSLKDLQGGFRSLTGAGVGNEVAGVMDQQQTAIEAAQRAIEEYETRRDNRLLQEGRFNAGQAWGRENEVNRIASQDDRQFQREGFNYQSFLQGQQINAASTAAANQLAASQANNQLTLAQNAARIRIEAGLQNNNIEAQREANRMSNDTTRRGQELQAEISRNNLSAEQNRFYANLGLQREAMARDSRSNERNRQLQAAIAFGSTPNFSYW